MALASKHPLPVSQANPSSVVVESYRALSTNLQFSARVDGCQTVLVTSSSSGEGKTLTAANLAIVSAQAGKKVLLIDADLRNPTLHLYFRLPNVVGLSAMVRDSTGRAILSTDTPGLFVLPSGPKWSNPLELLASTNFEKLIFNAHTEFDLVVLDSPPVLAVTDALVLSRLANGILLVVDTRKTQRKAVERAIHAIHQVNGHILGCVLNRTEKKRDRYHYLRHALSKHSERSDTLSQSNEAGSSLTEQPSTIM